MTISLIRGALEYSLDDGVYAYWLGDEGLGMAPLHRITSRGPMQHGETDLGFRLDPRSFVLMLELDGTSWSDLWTRRAALMAILTPTDDPMTVKFDLPNGSDRRIDCEYEGRLDLSQQAGLGFAIETGVMFRAGDPTFYKGEQDLFTAALGIGGQSFTVPMSVPTGVGASTLDATGTITYEGTFRSSPIIRILGPVTDAIVENLTTGEKLDFTGTTISAGTYREVNTGYGQHTVVDQLGANKIAELSDDSDLGTFHLAASPEASEGKNDIRVSGSGATAATRVSVWYVERFIGI